MPTTSRQGCPPSIQLQAPRAEAGECMQQRAGPSAAAAAWSRSFGRVWNVKLSRRPRRPAVDAPRHPRLNLGNCAVVLIRRQALLRCIWAAAVRLLQCLFKCLHSKCISAVCGLAACLQMCLTTPLSALLKMLGHSSLCGTASSTPLSTRSSATETAGNLRDPAAGGSLHWPRLATASVQIGQY